jgi:hypothetical protein
MKRLGWLGVAALVSAGCGGASAHSAAATDQAARAAAVRALGDAAILVQKHTALPAAGVTQATLVPCSPAPPVTFTAYGTALNAPPGKVVVVVAEFRTDAAANTCAQKSPPERHQCRARGGPVDRDHLRDHDRAHQRAGL